MREQVIISHRGARYEIGRGRGYYGIWPAGASAQAPPYERWPETREGWHNAWSRFTWIEAPGTIVPVSRQAGAPGTSRARAITAAGLLAVGVAIGIASLFPSYIAGSSLASEAPDLVPHLLYLAAWAASAVLILLGGARRPAGALLAAGTSIVTAGLFFADAATAMSSGSHGVGLGLILGLFGWLVCTAGAAAAVALGSAGAPARPQRGRRGLVLLIGVVTLAALGAAASFAPSWDSYTLHAANGATQTGTAGNAFANPAAVIAGDVVVMVALVVVAIAAAFWRPTRLGAVLLGGALVPMVAQAISALIQLAQGASPTLFGISPAQAAQAGITVSAGLTAAFWIYCVFLVALLAACGLMARPGRAAPAAAPPQPDLSGSGAGSSVGSAV